MTASPPESSRRLQYFSGAAAVVILLILIVAFSRNDPERVAPNAGDVDRQAAADAELQRQLRATLDGLRPERLNISADDQDIVGDLNLWWADYAATASAADGTLHAATIRKWLGDAAAANATAVRFSSRDAAHVRNAQMYRAIAASLAAGGRSERELATAAFELVTRHIALTSSFSAPVPVGSFEVLLAGRGTADDRIWVFAEILRQLRVDCVVLEPTTPPADAAVPAKLVGAILKGDGVLLFDPQLGLPIPPLDDVGGALPARAITLGEARQNDAVLRQFDVPDGAKYPWTSELLGAVTAKFIVDSTYGASRMQALQLALPAEHAATLFDGPATAADQPTLADRVTAAGADGGWSAESVSAWTYPEQQMTAFFAAGGEDSADVQNRLATLNGPRVLIKRQVQGTDQYVEAEEASPEPLRLVRVRHLRGDLLTALKGYGDVRSARLELAGNAEVREDAVHWVAVCQAELERYDVAISTLKLSLNNYPSGIWSVPTKHSLARCEALRGNLQQAVELVPATAADQAPNLADAYLARRWQALLAAGTVTQ